MKTRSCCSWVEDTWRPLCHKTCHKTGEQAVGRVGSAFSRPAVVLYLGVFVLDRCAVLIDAAHLIAEAGKLTAGTKNRALLRCDYGGMLNEIASMVEDDSDLPLLRSYWYDAAPDAVPTFEQLRIADLSGVKLRLGRLTRGAQKGVDALIYRDMTTLARERAVATMYVLGGDDDLLDGMLAAQDMGVQVTILGVEATSGRNQSGTLLREADDHIVLSRDFWEKYVTHVPESEQSDETDIVADGEGAGEKFALAYASRSSQEQVMELARMAPRIPKELDVQLLITTQRLVGEGQLDRDTKYAARAGFWKAIKRAARGEVVSDETDVDTEID